MSAVPEDHEQPMSQLQPRELKASDYAVGIFLLVIVAFLWTSSNFVTQYMFTGGYQKPFMITYLSTAAFTFYLLPFYLRKMFRGSFTRWRNANYQLLSPDLSSQPGSTVPHSFKHDDRLTPEETAKLALYFCFLWFIANWSLNAALAYTSVASATVLSSMSGIFTLAVGRIFRVETLTLVKIGAVLTSFGGVVLVSLSDSSSGQVPEPTANTQSFNVLAVVGDILALLSALFYAMYLILLKVKIKEESRIDMQLFFGYVGLFNILLCWPVGLLLHWFGVEYLELPDTNHAVVAILINMIITLLSDYIYVIAMLKTTPLVATVGLSLTIPLAVIGDYFLRKPAAFQVLLGAVLVTAGFIVVGVENSNPKEGDDLLAQDLVDEGRGQQALLRLEGATPFESQTTTSP
ncbi:hypothetical protein PAXRUDRAFT_823217 [Paxillus rubicundulus Ve08.2h10]|uniref:EamA domain-containing protein n=1 Tax=Paxillus rubicundulus Ve08.2h10 TaxID=930991 RepID=A0A0D0E922_9AGAM|nr:hypothetical protein PAXRUDRAFT_823217 [Paxillus rubicundulus Ve08.2h10]